MSKNRFKGFNVEESSSTRVELPVDVGSDPSQFGSISQYKPNLIDKIGDKMPKGVITDLLKGLYRGADDITFGALPSGNYQSDSRVSDMAEKLSWGLSPKGVGKSAKYVVSGGTPVSRLIANSVQPVGYTDKWSNLSRVLKSPKLFKEAVIDDIPQYILGGHTQDRLFAWRKKLGLSKPNKKYDKVLKNYGEESIDDIWNKFGKNPDGSYFYKRSKDYREGLAKGGQHKLFGSYVRKPRTETFKYTSMDDLDNYKTKTVKYEDYEDNWDFAFNNPIKNLLEGSYYITNQGTHYRNKQNLSTLTQRYLADKLTKPLMFKGSAKVQ